MICTFYSFKGGVGRSMALANVGEWLYLHGLRVVLVDWDLEAPGLEAFFPLDEGSRPVRQQPGLLDLLLDYKEDLPYLALPAEDEPREDVVSAMMEQLAPIRSRLIALRPPVTTGGSESALWILPAGQRGEGQFATYARAVQRFDWSDFYERYRGEAFFEWLVQGLLANDLADVVLIDTRTGISEMGGIGTRQLADVVVSFCVPNNQNIEGVQALTESFVREDVLHARGRAIQQLVVPTRIENSEIDARNWAKREFGMKLDHLRPEAMKRERRSFWELKIPYVPKYAYRETLAVGAPDAAEELVEAYQTLALQLIALAPEGSRARAVADMSAEPPRIELVPLPRISNVPPRIPLVVGRQSLLSEMRSRLTETPAPLVLYGLGGVGKTTLAIEYAHRFQPDYDVTWWLDASSPETIAAGYAELARQLGAAGAADDPVGAARGWLASHAGWLLVLDNASEPRLLAEQIPRDQRGHVVITSLNPIWPNLAMPLETPVLERSDATELIHRRTGDVDVSAADRLAAALGDLPLALEQAVSYMEATGRSLAGYLDLFGREGTRLLGRTDASPGVGPTWERAYRELLHHPLARDLLALCSMLGAEDVPIYVLAPFAPSGAPGLAFLRDPLRLDEAMGGLRRYSFASSRSGGLWVHPLLQAFVRGWLGDKAARATATVAVQLVRAALAGPERSDTPGSLLVHALAAADHAMEFGAAPVDVVDLLSVTASHQQAQGYPDSARATLSRAVEHAVKALGEKHPMVDTVRARWVALLIELGELEAANAALEQDLARARKTGAQRTIVRVLGDQGVVRLRLGDTKRAALLTQEALSQAQEAERTEQLGRLYANLALIFARTGSAAESTRAAHEAMADEPRGAVRALAAAILEGADDAPSEGVLAADLEAGGGA